MGFLVAFAATSACTTVVAQQSSGGGPLDAASDGGGSSSSGGGSSGSSSSSSSSGGGSVDAAACLPGDVTTYAPQYRPATGVYQGKCVGTDIAEFFNDCLAGPPKASVDNCNQFQSKRPDCAACVLTPDSAAKYGPLIGHGSFVTGNIAGCIELTDATTTGLACAKAVEALGGCELLACEANCDVHDATSLSAYNACASTADQAGCGTYSSASSCVQALQEAGDGVARCLVPDFATFYWAAAQLFCGTAPPVDAGASYDSGSPPPDGSTAAD